MWWDMLGVKLLLLDQAELAAEEAKRSIITPLDKQKIPRKSFFMGKNENFSQWWERGGAGLLPDPGASAGNAEVEAEVDASAGGSRFGGANGSEGGGRLLEGGCWMVCME